MKRKKLIAALFAAFNDPQTQALNNPGQATLIALRVVDSHAGANDDQVDAFTQALRQLDRSTLGRLR